MCTEKCRHVLTPKKFLYCWSLRFGSVFVGLFICLIMLLELICTSIQVYKTSKVMKTDTFAYRNNYGFSVVAVVYSLFMICFSIWFIWGVLKKKSSVVLSWLVVTAVWLAQTFVLLLVLLYLHSIDADFIGWLFAMIFGLVAMGILTWCLLVVLGYWIELKEEKKAAEDTLVV